MSNPISLLEQSLQQEECDSCAAIVDLASKGLIVLAVPAFSLAEPHVAILGKEKARSRLGNDLRKQLFELGRSKPHRAVPATFDALASVLVASANLSGMACVTQFRPYCEPPMSFRLTRQFSVQR
jgi:hypothetical protein